MVARFIALPSAAENVSLTITSSYGDGHGPRNYLSAGHYPKQGIGVIYETN